MSAHLFHVSIMIFVSLILIDILSPSVSYQVIELHLICSISRLSWLIYFDFATIVEFLSIIHEFSASLA